jgi:uncharacterized protein (TIGR01777 family)
MRILIAGAGGLIGSAVTQHLAREGYELVHLVRCEPGQGEVYWDPQAGKIDNKALDNLDGAVHLASMPWPTRWTAKTRRSILDNRLVTNRLIAESLASQPHKPSVLICASGMGYYPSSGDQIITEDSPPGTSFLANLQHQGEQATHSASEAGIRVVHLRIPPVLVAKSIPRSIHPIGNGRQWMSWISRDELASIIQFVLSHASLTGGINPVSPNPVRNAEFATVAARVQGRKTGLTIPAFLLHLMLGEMVDELILASRRMLPQRLLEAGYTFRYAELEQAMRHEIDVKS